MTNEEKFTKLFDELWFSYGDHEFMDKTREMVGMLAKAVDLYAEYIDFSNGNYITLGKREKHDNEYAKVKEYGVLLP